MIFLTAVLLAVVIVIVLLAAGVIGVWAAIVINIMGRIF